MSEEIVSPVGAESEAEVLQRILNQSPPEVVPVEVKEGACLNCANQGKESQLKDGDCPTCGFHQNNY